MKHELKSFLHGGIALLLLSPAAWGGPPTLSDLQLNQVNGVLETFAAATAFRPLEPASAYGKYWGLSLGATGTATSTSRLSSLLPGQNIPQQMPTGDIFIGLQAPLGLGVEFGFLPSVNAGGAKFHLFGGDVKWTINEALAPLLPFDLAARVGATSMGLSYSQSVSAVSDTVSYKSTLIETSLSLSKRLAIFEPYVGYGLVRQSSTLSNTGTVTLFSQSVSNTSSYTDSSTSGHFYGGLQLRLLLITITGQYDRMYGVDSESLKFGFKF